MKLPYTPKNVWHKHGGKILEITGIKHEINKPEDGRSRDTWFFLGRIRWNDGSGKQSEVYEIAPYSLCCDTDEGHAEISELLRAMNEYLAERGTWHHDGKTKHEGWYANRSKERRAA